MRAPLLLQSVLALALVAAGIWPAATVVSAQGDGCAPLADVQLVAQVIGAPLRLPTADDRAQQLARDHAGTVVLLGGAIESADQVRTLVGALDAASPPGIPPLIAVDEEGGRVARFGRSGLTTHLPSARDMAATMTADEVRTAAADLGAQMADLGVDWDLAPVLDLTMADRNTVIGDRSFGTDPTLVGDYAGAFAEGLQQSGLVTSGKHFPDHGLTTTDTHRAVASVDVSLDALRSHHLQPYRAAMPALDSIMLSHLRVSSLDPDLPATLSPAAVQMVRQELGFDRAIVTDDLSMQAVASIADQPTAALMALQAGVDVLLVGTPESAAEVHSQLVGALDDGRLGRERLRQAVRRALALKGITGPTASCLLGLPDVAEAKAIVDGDGVIWRVRDGVRQAVPDPQTAAAHSLDPVRYSDEERDQLPTGAPLGTVRRFQPVVVSGPGSDAGEVALARALALHGQQFLPGLVLVTGDQPWQRAIAATLSEGGLPIVATTRTPLIDRAVAEVVVGGRIDVVGPAADSARDRGAVVIDTPDPVQASLTAADERQRARGRATALIVMSEGVADDVVASVLPRLAQPGSALLLTPSDQLDSRVAARMSEMPEMSDMALLSVGLSAAASAAVDEIVEPAGGSTTHLLADAAAVADHLHRAHGWSSVALHGGSDDVLSGLPLLGEVGAVALHVQDARIDPAVRRVIAAWRLQVGGSKSLYGLAVDPAAHLTLGIPTHHDRPGSGGQHLGR